MTRKERIMQEAFKDMITTQDVHYSELEDKAREVQTPVYADAMRELKKNAKTRKEFVDDRIEEVQKKDGPRENNPKRTEAQKKMYLSESLFEATDKKKGEPQFGYKQEVFFIDYNIKEVLKATILGFDYYDQKYTLRLVDYQQEQVEVNEEDIFATREEAQNELDKELKESIVTRKRLKKLNRLAKNESMLNEEIQYKEAHNAEELEKIINEWDGDSLGVSIQSEESNTYSDIYYYFNAAGGYYEVPKNITSSAIEYDLQSAKTTALKYVNNFFDKVEYSTEEPQVNVFPEGYFAKFAKPTTKIRPASMLDESLKNDEIIKVADLAAEIGIETLEGLKYFIEHEVKDGDLLKSLQAYRTKLGAEFELGKENKDIKEDLDISFTTEQAQEMVDKINNAYKVEDTTDESVKAQDNGIANMLITAINDEWNTVKMYNDLIVNMETFGYPEMTEVIRDIINEENKHIGQLSKVLETISPNVANIEKGEQEAEEQLGDNAEVNND